MPIEAAPVTTRPVEVRPRPVREEPRPRPAPAVASSPAATPARARVEPDAALKWLDAKRSVTMPVSRIYIAAAAMIVVIVGVWWLAWEAGSAAEYRKWEPRLAQSGGSPPVMPTETQRQPIQQTPVQQDQTRQNDRTTPQPRPSVTTDTRVAGSNYLLIAANLSETEAIRAAEFLTASGIPAVAVTGDASARGRTFKVYSLLEIKSEEYSAKSALRSQHKSDVARLGQVWQREHRGSSSFAENQTMWEKYKP